ncbi:hypothetical protein ACERZ8_21285 [Tateyamaria armeniaca]|uniref:Methyltransferase n=1 Tax=Tateyamaria armeniaca TaxID=2518930 RepID=A0ABW8UYP9_9RHOB
MLKPGGWLCARTPNKWGYISLGANLVPNKFHVSFLKTLQPGRKAEDVFPTRYRLNTISDLKNRFPPERWSHHSYTWNSEPAYFGANYVAWRLMMGVQAILPRALGATLMVFIQKKK